MPRPGEVSLEVTLRRSNLVCVWIEQTAIASDMSLEPQDFTFQTHSLMQFKFKCRECMCIRLAFSTPELCGSQPKPTDTPILPALHTVTDKPGQLHCCTASAMVLFAHPYRKAKEETSTVVKYFSLLRQIQGNSAFLQSKAGPETKTTKMGYWYFTWVTRFRTKSEIIMPITSKDNNTTHKINVSFHSCP